MAETITIRDNRTGRESDLPISAGTVRATDLGKATATDVAMPLASYDPGYVNTVACKSSISYINGAEGILSYRGYPIEELAGKAGFLEVAYLLLHGELPNHDELAQWLDDINRHAFLHENMKAMIQGFRHDAHPMAILMSAVNAMHTFYPESRDIHDPESRALQIRRLIAKMPTLAAFAWRHTQGLPYVYPVDDRSYTENFLAMLFEMGGPYRADPRLVNALEILFVLHADHEQNCSTTAVRTVASSGNGPYTAVGAGIGALFGPLHGSANEEVMRMLRRIGDIANIREFVDGVKAGKERLMGFGHRVYKNYDPRARVIRQAIDDVFAVTGVDPLLKVAAELEKIALEDEYFVSRKLYPNVDFYSGLIYQALGFTPGMFTVLFAIPRTAGWLAQWEEQILDPEQKIARPKQIYTGPALRTFTPMSER
ncbi:citrate synthase [Enemella sp. A6]|uniref:citrate synthase n=1 Tax=Enemella sp. A6 TaxID=3440152 RepID=UPI003EBBC1D3